MYKKKIRGFTLLELLVVIAILGLLAGLVGPQAMKRLADSKTKTTKLQIEELSAALDMYKLDTDVYPDNQVGLSALVRKPSGQNRWNGPYLRKSQVPKDPWNREYIYRYPGKNGTFDIYSLGADNAEGGEAENQDVVSWN